MGLGSWWRAEDFNPEYDPDVIARRKGYEDVERRARERILGSRQNLQGLGQKYGAGTIYGNTLNKAGNRAMNYMDIAWIKDMIQAETEAKARQAMERRARQQWAGQLGGQLLSQALMLALSKLGQGGLQPNINALGAGARAGMPQRGGNLLNYVNPYGTGASSVGPEVY